MVCLCRGLWFWHAGQQRMPHRLHSRRSQGRLPDCCGRRWAGLCRQLYRLWLATWLLLRFFDDRHLECLLQHGYDWRRSGQLEAAVLRCAVSCTPIVGSLCVHTWVLIESLAEISRLLYRVPDRDPAESTIEYGTALLTRPHEPLSAPTVPTGPQSTVPCGACCKASACCTRALWDWPTPVVRTSRVRFSEAETQPHLEMTHAGKCFVRSYGLLRG